MLASLFAVASAYAGSAIGREPYASFYTPGKAAYCGSVVDITGDNPGYVPWLYCWTPNDGFTIELRDAKARPSARNVAKNKWHYEPSTRRLTYRQDWWVNRAGQEGTGTGGGGGGVDRGGWRTNGPSSTKRGAAGLLLAAA